eukprot:3855218-Heterocapsa_arctica.AAC.1
MGGAAPALQRPEPDELPPGRIIRLPLLRGRGPPRGHEDARGGTVPLASPWARTPGQPAGGPPRLTGLEAAEPQLGPAAATLALRRGHCEPHDRPRQPAHGPPH